MRLARLGAALTLLLGLSSAKSNLTTPPSTQQILQGDFQVPQVWENTNLVRTTNLDKGFVRETINVVVSNKDSEPQSDYYVPFEYDQIGDIGGFEARDKKDGDKPPFEVTTAALAAVLSEDGASSKPTQYFIVHLPSPIPAKESITLSLSYHILNNLTPLPAAIKQDGKQYLTYSFSALYPSAYSTLKQKSKLKLPSSDIPSFTTTTGLTKSSDPEKQGSSLTYGSYDTPTPPGTLHPVTIRYENTAPLLTTEHLHRIHEISHWGSNLATEDHYLPLAHTGAALSEPFSRTTWATQSFYIQSGAGTTFAARELKFSLPPGSVDAYFTDDIGNVSTSRFRPTPRNSPNRDASLELKPRYPLFGGWRYKFRIGWNNDLSAFVRKLSAPSTPSDSFILRVPLLAPPSNNHGLSIQRLTVDIILPEGSEILGHTVSGGQNLPTFTTHQSIHRTFMDTLGRTVLTLETRNVVDEARDAEVLVTYRYTTASALRKPLSVVLGMMGVFGIAYLASLVDTSIGKNKQA